MDFATYKKLMKEALVLPGFEFDPGKRGSVYMREDAEWRYSISMDNLFRADYLQAMCSGATLTNKAVEAVFAKVLDKHREHLHQVVVTFTDYKQYDLIDTRKQLVRTESDLLDMIAVWSNEIHSNMLPFLGSWNDLNRINNEIIRVVSPAELPRYLPGATLLKRLIIMRLVNDEGYEAFLHEREAILQKSIAEGRTEYKSFLEAFLELKSILG